MRFTKPENFVAELELKPGQVVADVGCGGGYYVLPAAKSVGAKGVVYAIDIVPAMCEVTLSAAQLSGLKNVHIVEADFTKPFGEIKAQTCDAVIAAGVLHQVTKPEMVLRNVYQLLKTGGLVLVVEWKKESTLLGPSLDMRIDEAKMEQLLINSGLKKLKSIEQTNDHYALLYQK